MGCCSTVKLPWEEIQKEEETAVSDILITGACVRGPRHKKEGTPCQDAWGSFPVNGGGWVITAADGLSSALHADLGAKDAVTISGETLASSLSLYKEITDKGEQIREAVRTTRNGILSRARENERKPVCYASTLIILCYEHGTVSLGHIGDGMVVGIRKGKSLIISSPEPGEYANETACLVQDDWEKHLRIVEFSNIEACIIATDGCQGALALRSEGVYIPHDPFILPLVSFVRQRMTTGIDPKADIAALLVSQRMEQLSGDDKTLIVLSRGGTAQS